VRRIGKQVLALRENLKIDRFGVKAMEEEAAFDFYFRLIRLIIYHV
jgi:hypothetical protein